MTDETLFFTPIRDLALKIRRNELSPVDLTAACLARLETTGRKLNAVATLMRESAMAEARQAEREIRRGRYRSLLHGIPYGVKDLLATRGVPTTWGAEPYRNQVFDYDATIVERLREAGAILVAKLAMVELAGGMGYNHADAAWTGPGLTPWNTAFWSGGSSSGPGSAVAAGLVPFAIGSETSGSILTPCAFCGVTGLRPTYGLVSRHGAMALCWTLDKLGPMARGADDCALVLAAITGRDPRDETTTERRFIYSKRALVPHARMRIAVPKGVVEGVQPAVRENFETTMQVISEWCDVTREVEWPDMPWGPSVSAIVAAEGAAAFIDLIEAGRVKELSCPKDRHGGYAGAVVPAVDYIQAMRVRRPMKRAVARVFESFDAVAAPTRSTVAYPADRTFDQAYPGVRSGPPLIPAGNLVGIPSICMPNGFGENGLPTSVSFMGSAFSEDKLVQIGVGYQDRTDWHRRQPPAS
jgi:aspartyl-tRNA(Asn)/glutamyl-tRNA(Gln) amidotransferase subunit A